MPGLKIEIDVNAAKRASAQLRQELKTLGSSAVDNEKDFQKLEKRLEKGMKADKAKKAIDSLKDSIKLNRLEMARHQARIGDYSGAFKTITSGAGKATSQLTILTAAVSALAVGGATILGSKFLDTAKKFEQFEIQLKTITGSAEKAEAAMAWITEFTAKTPYELDQVTESFVKLNAYGLDAPKWMKTLGDTAAAMGKSLDQSVEMFADAAVGEFERLKEFGVKASTEGDTVAFRWSQNGKDMVKTAQKTQSGITSALGEIFSRFDGSMNDLSNSWTGMVSNISDIWTQFQNEVMTSGPFEAMKESLKSFLDYLESNEGQMDLKTWANETATAVLEAFRYMAKGVEVFQQSIAGIRVSFGSLMKLAAKERILRNENAIENTLDLYSTPDENGFLVNIERQNKYSAQVGVYQERLASAKEDLAAANMMINENSQAIIDSGLAYDKINQKLKSFQNSVKSTPSASGASGLNGKSNKDGGNGGTGGTTDTEAKKTAKAITSAYTSAYSSLDTMTQSTFDFMMEKYRQDYNEFIKLTGDKETAMAVYSQNVVALTEKMYGADTYDLDFGDSSAWLDEKMAATEKFQDAYKQATMTTTAYKLDQLRQQYDNYSMFIDDKAALNEWSSAEQQRINEDTINSWSDAFSGWATSYSSSLNDMLWGSETTFSDITTSFGKMITEMIIQQELLEPFLSSATGDGGWISAIRNMTSGLFHTGGVVGSGDGGTRSVSPMVFAGAPRFHSGLMPDEFAAILQRGETVFTSNQTAALGNMILSNNTPPSVILNIENYTNSSVESSQSQPKWDGEGWVIGIVLNAMNNNTGNFRSTMKAKLGS